VKHKAYKRTRNKARKYFEKWTYLLGLRWYNVQVNWYDNEKAFRKASGAEGRNVAMRVYSDWRYMTAVVYVNVPALAGMSDRELEEGIVHELCHILVNEMREKDIGHEERTVTMLASAFMWVSRKGKDHA